jgi:putative FmdB family regulatory protein
MPTYEFRCPKGHDFEKFYRTISGAEAQAACPECGELAERIMSPAGFAFKGSGFYLTDYGKNAHREKGSAPKPAAGESSSSDSGSSSSTLGTKGESAKGGAGESAGASSAPASPAPAAESKPAGPKKSSDE